MKVVNIGRHPENDVVVNDPIVGRRHVQIVQHDDGHFTIVDLNSTNGTFVNGKLVSGEVPLNPGDDVRIGRTSLPWMSYFSSSVQPPLLTKKERIIIMILGIVGGVVVLCLILVLLFGRGKLNNEEKDKIEPSKPVIIIPDSISAAGAAKTTGDLPEDTINDSPSTKVVTEPKVEKDKEQKSKEKPENETTRIKQEDNKVITPDSLSGKTHISPTDTFGMYMNVMQMQVFINQANVELGKCKRIIQSVYVPQKDYEKAWNEAEEWKRQRDIVQKRLDKIKAEAISLLTDTFGLSMNAEQMQVFINQANIELSKRIRIIHTPRVTAEEYLNAWGEIEQWRNYRDVIQMQLDSIKASNSSKH